MPDTEYTLELKDEGLDEQGRQEVRQRIEDEFDIALEDPKERTELADPATLIAAYSATVVTLGLLIDIYNTFQDEDEPVRVEISGNVEGDVYFVDADYASQIGVDVIEEQEGTAVAEMDHEEVMKLQRLKRED